MKNQETKEHVCKKEMLMGNEAIARGAIRAGVSLVSGYPGTPSTEILETVCKYNQDKKIYVEWSTNEKSALEVAAGASYAGARTMVTMKQVGLNVASDPLMSLNYVGIKGGMVIVVADDPGPISSQTEQDTRHFGIFSKIMVFDPSTPEEAYTMVADAFEYSEKYGRPVLLRPTTRICHSYASVKILENLEQRIPEGFDREKDNRVIFPKLAYENHKIIEADLVKVAEEFSSYEKNILSGSGKKGIATGGVSYTYACEALEGISSQYKLLKVSTIPFPTQLGVEFLDGLDEVLVIEELDPVIEKSLIFLCGLHNIKVTIKGKLSGHIPNAGENKVNAVSKVIEEFLSETTSMNTTEIPEMPELPVRPPVLCAGCPHRSSFVAVKEATKKRKSAYSGDIGCYTLGNAIPLEMVDTCLCMGGGITVAQGLNRVDPDTLNFAFIGDSTFFHTGIPGIVNAVYNGTDIIVVILDNFTTAMTGNQPHPGMGKNAMGEDVTKLSIYDIVKAIGVAELKRVDVFDYQAAQEAVTSVLDKKGVRVILFEGPCIAIEKGDNRLNINQEKCTKCRLCIKKLGCPAISYSNDKVHIDPVLCTGCELCKSFCPCEAIEGGEK